MILPPIEEALFGDGKKWEMSLLQIRQLLQRIDSNSSSLMCVFQLRSGLDCFNGLEGYCSINSLMRHAIRVYVQY